MWLSYDLSLTHFSFVSKAGLLLVQVVVAKNQRYTNRWLLMPLELLERKCFVFASCCFQIEFLQCLGVCREC